MRLHLSGDLKSRLQRRPSGPRAEKVLLTSIPSCQQLREQPAGRSSRRFISEYFRKRRTTVCECAKQVVLTGSRLVLGSEQRREPCSSPAVSYIACSRGRLCGSTSGLCGTTDLEGKATRSERFDSRAAGFLSFCVII